MIKLGDRVISLVARSVSAIDVAKGDIGKVVSIAHNLYWVDFHGKGTTVGFAENEIEKAPGEGATVKQPERRYRAYSIPDNAILTLMGRWKGRDSFHLPLIDNIPDGAILEAVIHNWQTHSFIFKVSHESFPEVPPGEELKVIPSTFHLVCVNQITDEK